MKTLKEVYQFLTESVGSNIASSSKERMNDKADMEIYSEPYVFNFIKKHYDEIDGTCLEKIIPENVVKMLPKNDDGMKLTSIFITLLPQDDEWKNRVGIRYTYCSSILSKDEDEDGWGWFQTGFWSDLSPIYQKLIINSLI